MGKLEQTQDFIIRQIGLLRSDAEGFRLELRPEYRPAMAGLEGFGCLNILWWFSGCDNTESRGKLVERAPYRHGPEELGVFATRSPDRPNPIALSCAGVTYVDRDRGVIGLDYIDADDGSPVLDMKPYTPGIDRVEYPKVPEWCAHWPANVEASGEFDWTEEFNF